MSKAIDWQDYIVVDPDICHGKPCFKGTRIMVATILELLEASASAQEIRSGYPRVTRAHIQAAMQFARELFQNGRFIAFRSRRHAAPHR